MIQRLCVLCLILVLTMDLVELIVFSQLIQI